MTNCWKRRLRRRASFLPKTKMLLRLPCYRWPRKLPLSLSMRRHERRSGKDLSKPAGASSCRKWKLKPSGSGTVYETSLYAACA